MIPKPTRDPVQVRSLALVEALLTAARKTDTPEGRYVLNRLKTRAKHAQERAPKVAKKRAERKAKGGKTVSDLIHMADRVFSLFIRWRDTWETVGGRVGRCVTCNRVFLWAELQCGHWIRRENWGTRWEDRNCHAQDVVCNNYKGGAEEAHAAAIEAIHDRGTCDRLRVLARVNAAKPKELALRAVINEFAIRLQLMDYPGDLEEFLAEGPMSAANRNPETP